MYKHLEGLSTAYDPRIYEIFFTRQTGHRANDVVLSHTKHEFTTPLELEELQTAALAWQDLTPPPPDSKAKWKVHRHPQRGHQKERLEYAILLPDTTVLFLTIQGR